MKPSIRYIKECFTYCAASGVLTWLARPVEHFSSSRYQKCFNTQFQGEPAGAVRKRIETGCMYIMISLTVEGVKTTIEAHRICFALFHGWLPESVDHFDGNGMNNRPSNLRPADKRINGRNRKMNADNKTGIMGVYPKDSGWIAYGCGRPKIYLGRFRTIFEAACARKQHELAYEFTRLHGRTLKAIPA